MLLTRDVSLGVGWGGVGMMTFLGLAHMFDATHTGCFSRSGVGWGGDDDVPRTCTHGRYDLYQYLGYLFSTSCCFSQ